MLEDIESIETEEKKMTFFEHLDEFRRRLMYTAIVFVIAAIAVYPYAFGILLDIFKQPLSAAIKLHYLNPMEPFLARLKLTLFAAFLVSSPVIFYHFFAFLAPALKKREKRLLYGYVFTIFILFVMGVVLGYNIILPVGLKWLIAQGQGEIIPVLKVTEYVSVVGWFLIAFGIAFETPVILFAFVKLGIMSKETLKANWRVVYIVILTASAILTPDFSPVTMLLLALPMILLYHLTILALRWL